MTFPLTVNAASAGADLGAYLRNPGRTESLHLKDWGKGEGRR